MSSLWAPRGWGAGPPQTGVQAQPASQSTLIKHPLHAYSLAGESREGKDLSGQRMALVFCAKRFQVGRGELSTAPAGSTGAS